MLREHFLPPQIQALLSGFFSIIWLLIPIGRFIPAGVAKYKAKVGIPTIEATCIAPESLPIKPSHKLKIAAILSNEVYGIIGS